MHNTNIYISIHQHFTRNDIPEKSVKRLLEFLDELCRRCQTHSWKIWKPTTHIIVLQHSNKHFRRSYSDNFFPSCSFCICSFWLSGGLEEKCTVEYCVLLKWRKMTFRRLVETTQGLRQIILSWNIFRSTQRLPKFCLGECHFVSECARHFSAYQQNVSEQQRCVHYTYTPNQQKMMAIFIHKCACDYSLSLSFFLLPNLSIAVVVLCSYFSSFISGGCGVCTFLSERERVNFRSNTVSKSVLWLRAQTALIHISHRTWRIKSKNLNLNIT